MDNINTKNLDLREIYSKEIPSTTYLTHGIHPYTAKLIPHIPRYFIEKYTEKNEVILDPFCGSGTTLLEARLLERNAIGIDINPLAILLSKVKTTPLDVEELKHTIQLCKENLKEGKGKIFVDFPNIDYWFCNKAQNDLAMIKYSIESLNGKVDRSIYKFLLLCFSSVIRKSSYADPRMAKTYKSKRVIEKIKKGWIPMPTQYFEKVIENNLERIKLLSELLNSTNNYAEAFQEDASELSFMLKQNGIKNIDFIITSPPYINAQDYFRSYKLELWWLGLATPEEVKYLNRQAIGTENLAGVDYNFVPQNENRLLNTILKRIWKVNRKKSHIIYNYFRNMDVIFKQCYNVLKVGGYFCVITGNNTICGVQIPTHKIFSQMAENTCFRLVEMWGDEIKNRTLPPKRNHNGGIIKKEWITVFQKEESGIYEC